MKRLLLPALLLAASSTLFAQEIAGTWQGTVQQQKPSRLILKISKTSTSSLKASIYRIDISSQNIPASVVTIQNATVKFSIPLLGTEYTGKLSDDGNVIVGAWTQVGQHSLPLTFTRATPETTWPISERRRSGTPMAVDVRPVFEIATIKPSDPNGGPEAQAPEAARILPKIGLS